MSFVPFGYSIFNLSLESLFVLGSLSLDLLDLLSIFFGLLGYHALQFLLHLLLLPHKVLDLGGELLSLFDVFLKLPRVGKRINSLVSVHDALKVVLSTKLLVKELVIGIQTINIFFYFGQSCEVRFTEVHFSQISETHIESTLLSFEFVQLLLVLGDLDINTFFIFFGDAEFTDDYKQLVE